MIDNFDNWQRNFWNRFNRQMQEEFEKQVKFTEQQAKHQMDLMNKQIEQQWDSMNKQIEKQIEFTEQQAEKSLELSMKNADMYLNQNNPTLAMFEFERARLYRLFLRK